MEWVPGLEPADGGRSDESQISVSADETRIYYTGIRPPAYGIFTATRTSSSAPFGGSHMVVAPRMAPPHKGQLTLVGEANIATTPSGEIMVLMCGVAGSDVDGGASDITLRICATKRK